MRRLAIAIAALAIVACGVDGVVLRDGAASIAGADDAGADALAPLGDASAIGDAYGVFSGQDFSCALRRGVAYCWGNNVQGALGTGDRQNALVPTRVAAAVAFDALALGAAHTCGLEHGTGRVLCWGYNANGQLGLGDTTLRTSPTAVSLPGPATQITAGYDHTCAVLADGSLDCWGANAEGEIGLGDASGAPDVLAPARVGGATDWLRVSGGQGHTCGIRRTSGASGTMHCWGRNTASELGQGSGAPIQIRTPAQVGTIDAWTDVDLGQDDACALRDDGTLWCWGDRGAGELTGGASTTPLDAPLQVGTDADWARVSTDVFETCGIKRSGALECWGRNVEGQLGVGDTTDRDTPTPAGTGTSWATIGVGRFYACAESVDHVVSCTGAAESGQLGQNDVNRRDSFTPVVAPPSF